MKINIIEFVTIILIFINLSCITPVRDSQYYDCLKEVKAGNIDFAFMKLNNYLRENPASIHIKEIRFAIAEYYFQIKDYSDAIYKLIAYIKDYQGEESVIFAQALLYRILLEYKQTPELVEKIREKFFSKSLFLIFSDSKIKYYKSILNNTYKIVDYIDKIEVFKNNDPFLKITP